MSAYVVGGCGHGVRRVPLTYQPAGLLERPVHAVHLVVEAASVAEVVAGAVSPPQRRVDGAAVHALAPLREKLCHLDCANTPYVSSPHTNLPHSALDYFIHISRASILKHCKVFSQMNGYHGDINSML